jgi:hypothetical protein
LVSEPSSWSLLLFSCNALFKTLIYGYVNDEWYSETTDQ